METLSNWTRVIGGYLCIIFLLRYQLKYIIVYKFCKSKVYPQIKYIFVQK